LNCNGAGDGAELREAVELGLGQRLGHQVRRQRRRGEVRVVARDRRGERRGAPTTVWPAVVTTVVVGSPAAIPAAFVGRAAADDRQRDAAVLKENVIAAAVLEAVVP